MTMGGMKHARPPTTAERWKFVAAVLATPAMLVIGYLILEFIGETVEHFTP